MKHAVPIANRPIVSGEDGPGLYSEVYETDLQSRLANPEASFALAQWLVQAARGDIPEESAYLRPHLDWLDPDVMLIKADRDGELVYVRYGSRIAGHAGFSMKGRRVSEFQGSVGRFFRRIYLDVMQRPRPVATVHRLGNFHERPMWERVILPLATGGAVSSLYVVNCVRDLGREFNEFSARSRGNGVIALQFIRGPNGEIAEAIIVGANLAAREMTGRRLDELLNRPMVECFPGVVAAGLWDRYMIVAETREPQRLLIDYGRDGVTGTFDVLITPFLDGVSIDFASCAGV